MGQQPWPQLDMNPTIPARSSGYHQKALVEIHNSLLPFAKSSGDIGSSSAASTISNLSTTSGVSSLSSTSGSNGTDKDFIHIRQCHSHLLNMGYTEEMANRATQVSGGRLEVAIDYLNKQMDSNNKSYNKLIRKPSIERDLALRGSPALDSGAGSSRSDSPRLAELHPPVNRQYSPSNFSEPPPPPPPRNTPPPPPPHVPYQSVPSNLQQMFKRMSPAPVVPSRAPPAVPSYSSPASSQRGTSPVSIVSSSSGRQPMVVQNGPQVQQQLNQQMQALNLYQSSTTSNAEPPPPYPLISPSPSNAPPPPPSYSASIQNRQSPTQDFRKSPSSGIYSGSASTGSPSPVPASTAASSMPRPTPQAAWGTRQAKTQPPIIMQSVKSTQVQKPVLQTAVAPTSPQIPPSPTSTTPPANQVPPPSYTASIQQKQAYAGSKPAAPNPVPTSSSVAVPTTEPPSYASTMQAKAKAVQRGIGHPPMPPPPYSDENIAQVATVESGITPRAASHIHPPLQRKFSPAVPSDSRSDSPQSANSCEGRLPPSYPDSAAPPLPPTASSSVMSKSSIGNGNNNVITNGNGNCESRYDIPQHAKIKHQSPIPERKKISKEKEDERRDGKVKNYSPQAFKFFMEQHIENVIKSYKQRMFRRIQLENEMSKIGLSPEAQQQMRKMLSQKESNYIRLKRAKMDKSMFVKIKPIGVGAFGEVTLVKKIDTNHLYAMKTLRKADVLKRNQVAHVKAERDILAEADNEWVVKLYYSFQDSDILYFVMDYIPGGDLMSLLIKFGVFEEHLARFYIAELTCAVESVHKMGFIHRDIKPDNILIDKDGHIKLTDFGLCTGFRWTHNSKYYQPNDHNRQDSMEPIDDWNEECRCKPLERRRRMEHQRCLAHSLVGTPNYIAPEVLQRKGYTQLCDWWSVGVILYEMLVGSPPFLANTPAETQYKVINWETTLQIPKAANLSPESKDLILNLCCSAEERLGKNANEVKSHPFFKNIDFDKGLRRQPAPHVPRIDYPTDTSNFDPIDPDKLRNSGSLDSTKSDEQLDISKPFHGFFEFTFRRFFDDGGGPPFNKINLDDNENQGAVYV